MKKQCVVCGEAFTPLYPARKTCSANCLRQLFQANNAHKKGTGRGKNGYYADIYCSSTYELAFVIWAIDWGLPIQRSTRRIDYSHAGKSRAYYPDFEIGNTTYEIKGRKEAGTNAKARAARAVCNYVLIDKSKIGFYLDYVRAKYGKKVEDIYPVLYGGRPKHRYVCSNCGNGYEVTRKKKKTQTFCSNRCAGQFRMARVDRAKALAASMIDRKPSLPADKIKTMYKSGKQSYADLASIFRCSKARIGQILKGVVRPTGVEPAKFRIESPAPFPPGEGRLERAARLEPA